MAFPSAALLAGFDYVRKNPMALVTVARQAARMHLVAPLDLVRWGLGKIRSERVSDFSVSAQPPGVAIGLTVHVMGSRLRVGGILYIDRIEAGPGLLRVEVRVQGLKVDALDGPGSPVQQLLSSGAIDLAKPGNLVSFLPKRPAFLVEAEGDRFVFDLMQIRSLAENPLAQRILGAITPVLSIRDVETANDDLLIGVRVRPTGLPLAIASLRS